MTDHFLITPPPELVEQWLEQSLTSRELAAKAFQAGADQELEACVAWLDDTDCEDPQEASLRLRWHRRPKLPSLKEQAVFAAAVLRSPDETCSIAEIEQHWHTIRRALEALDD